MKKKKNCVKHGLAHNGYPSPNMAIQLLINCEVMSYWHTVTASPLSIVVTHCPGDAFLTFLYISPLTTSIRTESLTPP